MTSAPSIDGYLVVEFVLKQSRNLPSVAAAHCKLFKNRSCAAATAANHLINAYGKLRRIVEAQRVVDEMLDPNVVTFTSLMSGYIGVDQPDHAISIFRSMEGEGIRPNAFTFATAVNACSRLADAKQGGKLQACIEKLGFHGDIVVSTSLIGLYGRTSDLAGARRVFDSMPKRNDVSWCSMITTYAQNARGHEALTLFKEFWRQQGDYHSHANNPFMLSAIINACTTMGRLRLGRAAHTVALRSGHPENEWIAGTLVDMYAKCGDVESSCKVFNRIHRPSLITFTSMIVAAAKYGFGSYSLSLFDTMLSHGLKPNSITLLGVLHACCHSGLVDIGLRHLNSMQLEHGICPTAKHYTCAVDMLGRAGRLNEAYELAKRTGAQGEDSLMLWSSLLSASRTHKRLDIVAEARKVLAGFERDVAGTYILMSDTYESAGHWAIAAHVRSEMDKLGIRKEPGCSWVEYKDAVYVFYAGRAAQCPRGDEVVELLRKLGMRSGEKGGNAREEVVDEDETVATSSIHSEQLALGFGLLSFPMGAAIRIMKNLRMCSGCHGQFKAFSDILGRDFVVRDLNRFHHFSHGSCSCKDYW